MEKDTIKSLNNITEKHCLPGYQYRRAKDHIVMYKLTFNESTGCPAIHECIKIDIDLHVKLQYHGSPIPLPQWFRDGTTATLTRFSMLQNFPCYFQSATPLYPILSELQN